MRNCTVAAVALVLGVMLGLPALSPTAVSAHAYAAPDGSDDAPNTAKSTNAGTINGIVTKVDYQKGRITIDAGPKGTIEVTVLPSTTIQGKADFTEISDIVKGQHLTIFLSQKGDEKIAQIIQLQK